MLLTYRLLLCPLVVVTLFFFSEKTVGQVSPADYDYPHNHLPWFTIESEHFLVHYQKGNSRTAQITSQIAQEIYDPVTSLYGHHPRKKVSIVLRDREDFSNGAAFFYDDKIEIWIPALDTPLRGTHHWLRNVITHEFTHIVQLGASMKRTQRIPAIYFQWLTYEDVRRPDVLYGFPNGIVTFPFSSVSVPAWFAEGTAQYQREEINHDFWDSHRDMVLRTRLLSGTYLDFTEMGTFTSKTSLERELVYNQGFDFTRYLTGRFGENVIADISKASAENAQGNFNNAFKTATGISGTKLFRDWIEETTEYYLHQVKNITITESNPVEEDGFFNFYPQFNSDGSVFAYLTNRGRDVTRTTLLVLTDDKVLEADEPGGTDFLDSGQRYMMSHGYESNPSIEFVSNRFSFSPDGSRIAYNRPNKNRLGENYQDLYIFDITNQSRTKITESARVQDPAWHPREDRIAAVQQNDGTQNLVIIDSETGQIESLTNFYSGETVYTPVWSADGNILYFSAALDGNRNIYRFNLETAENKPVLTHPEVDFRDPWIEPVTGYLYFSSDLTGIFNVYRKELADGSVHQITDVTGGAFMPFAKVDSLYFSEYRHDGYKISRISIRENLSEVSDHQKKWFHPDTSSTGQKADYSEIKNLPFTDDHPWEVEISFSITEGGTEDRIWRPYSETTTGLSIFPVIRFDNYTRQEGSNSRLLQNAQFGDIGQNLWRDLKAGVYLSSRDVTESFSIFGGAMLGWGSLSSDGLVDFFSPTRINNLDRDIFLIMEHRGLPFIRRSWSPTVRVELYNLKRNVQNGLTIEEFPCTSCLPVERSVDIRYLMWEANLLLRSKLNRWSLLELGASYSPYSVSTEGFFSDEFREFIPGSTSEYFRGASYSVSYIAESVIPNRHQDIAPQGLRGHITYRFEPGRLLQEFEISDGTLSPVFSIDRNHSLETRVRFGLDLGSETNAMITTRAFTFLNKPDDYFYLDYAGGLSGMRSYPYFALGGQRTFFTRASVIHPIFEKINHQVHSYTLDKLFAHLFFEAGNGWSGPLEIGRNLKTGVGAELRFAFNSSYLFPMNFFVNTTYGFNKFNVTLPSQFILPNQNNTVQYGRELLFYFGLTFDFDLL
jgi:Tol biopolymer transport system component